jgi:Tfp pilus assembly protein PilF
MPGPRRAPDRCVGLGYGAAVRSSDLPAALVLLVLVAACGDAPESPPTSDAGPSAAPAASDPAGAPPTDAAASYVGSGVCASCHPEEAARWRGSHHDLAMQEADAGSVLGDWGDVTASHAEVSARFLRRDEAFVVETQDEDGALRELEVAYTFGAWPLQQVLVPLPDGRLQALDFAWDARPEAAGGGRWFHLHPEETVRPGDVLHWTGPAYRWNSMCADCHSTAVRRDYDAEADRWTASWEEVDVGCEACHGPGSLHAAAAREGRLGDGSGLTVDLAREGGWRFEPGRPIAVRTPAAPEGRELETCAPCHARRARLVDAPQPGEDLLQGHRPALLEEGLYHADGQILDEVFVWGSFVQSRMHAAGVTCSDCHDPHALGIEDPDATCAGCHRAEVFAAPEHHHHPSGSEGARCVGCHMPARTYMVVDDRRDHGFRVPRPDLAEALGVPDACTGCHADRTPAWAAQAALDWWGPARRERGHWAPAIHAGRTGAPGAAAALRAVFEDEELPAIVRATAVALVAERIDGDVGAVLADAARDPEPLVRMAGATGGRRLEAPRRARALGPLLRDPVRAVRAAAGRTLADVPDSLLEPAARAARDAALEEWRGAQRVDGGRAAARVNLAALHAERGELDAAERELQVALRLNPHFVPAWVNRADLARARGDDARAEAFLRRALEVDASAAEVHHALGLTLVRAGRLEEALASLERAAGLAPQEPRFTYVHAVALHGAGRTDRALALLEAAQRRHPTDRSLLVALATMHRDAGQRAQALAWARALAALEPDDPGVQALVQSLETPEGGGP